MTDALKTCHTRVNFLRLLYSFVYIKLFTDFVQKLKKTDTG